MTDKQKDIKIKTICNCCLICHERTNNPNPFYICDKCKAKLKTDKEDKDDRNRESRAGDKASQRSFS